MINEVIILYPICCFAGHRDFLNTECIEEKLKKHIISLITNENVTEFMLGNYGNFDKVVNKVLFSVKEAYPHIKITLVVPYLTTLLKEQRNEKYECILIADMPENTPRKYQILKCNEYMVSKSQFIICYVKNTWGGAYKTLSRRKVIRTRF